jgi:hypothetical protein
MDLNEKLAQRRKEREIEAAAIQKEIVKKEVDKIKVIEEIAQKRLAEKGYPIAHDNEVEKSIQKQVVKIENKMATDRMTGWENFYFLSLVFIGIILLFESVILGLLFLAVAVWYLHQCIDKYKKIIVAEELFRRAGNDI